MMEFTKQSTNLSELELNFFFFSSRRRHTRYIGDWSSDVCSSDLPPHLGCRDAGRLGEVELLQRLDAGQVRRLDPASDRSLFPVLQLRREQRRQIVEVGLMLSLGHCGQAPALAAHRGQPEVLTLLLDDLLRQRDARVAHRATSASSSSNTSRVGTGRSKRASAGGTRAGGG